MAETISISIRLRAHEKKALFDLAEKRGVSASEVARRLIREAVYHGPTFFEDELKQVIALNREVAAVGRNLNQIARRVNSGEVKERPLTKKLIQQLAFNQKRCHDILHEMIKNSRFRRAALRRSTLTRFVDKSDKYYQV